MQNKQIDIIKYFCILGLKVSICILLLIIILTKVFFICGVSINVNMQDLIGLNILDVMISKEHLDLSIKPLGMLLVFIISGAIGTFLKVKKITTKIYR